MGPIGYTETSVRNSRQSLRNIPEERSSYVNRFVRLYVSECMCRSFKRLNSLTSFYEI